jgi:hypothetical protein
LGSRPQAQAVNGWEPVLGLLAFVAGMAALVFVVSLVKFGPRVLKREFWRLDPNEGRQIARVVRGIGLVIYWIFRVALGIAIFGGLLYGVVWVLHALWRAT